jgi:hypothetical protein
LFQRLSKPSAESGVDSDGAHNVGRDDRMCAYGALRIKVDSDTFSPAGNSINPSLAGSPPALRRSLVLVPTQAGAFPNGRLGTVVTASHQRMEVMSPFAVGRRRCDPSAELVEDQQHRCEVEAMPAPCGCA